MEVNETKLNAVAEKVAGGRRGSRPSARSGITKSRSPGRR